jgi:hypothetical protein
MKPIHWYAFSAALLLTGNALSNTASAAESSRTVKIQNMAGVSTSRPGAPQSQSVIRIYPATSAAWGSTSCRADAADISMDDWHLYGIAMRAWKDNVTVTITVDDTQIIDTSGDHVCRVMALHAVP